MQQIIFHIDVNSAFLSWTAIEQLKNGAEVDLRTIPSIIGGNQESRHGVVLAKSVPAKKYGIVTGEPVANALRKCPNLTMAPPNHKMYTEFVVGRDRRRKGKKRRCESQNGECRNQVQYVPKCLTSEAITKSNEHR